MPYRTPTVCSPQYFHGWFSFHRLLDVKYGEACLYYRREGDSWEPSELEDLMGAVGAPDPTGDDASGGSGAGNNEEDEDAWMSLGTSNPREAAEQLANIILASLQTQCVVSMSDCECGVLLQRLPCALLHLITVRAC